MINEDDDYTDEEVDVLHQEAEKIYAGFVPIIDNKSTEAVVSAALSILFNVMHEICESPNDAVIYSNMISKGLLENYMTLYNSRSFQ